MTRIRRRRLAAAICIALLAAGTLSAQDQEDELFVPTYSLGDQLLRINLGLFVPLFFAGADGVAPANLTLGGVGSIGWASYLSNEVTLGVEIGGSFSLTPNRRALFLVPIAAQASYIFRAYPFEFPVTAALGINFSRLGELLKVDPFLKAGGSFYWNYSTQWAFGANLYYWFIPQIYTAGSTPGPEATRLGNFLDITLSALYRF